jgi:hypothetical protein
MQSFSGFTISSARLTRRCFSTGKLAAAAGSIDGATKEEKAAQRKWERACNDATERARAVINAPALTLEGMLMKIHVAGFNVFYTKTYTFSAPYHGMICGGRSPQHWEPANRFHPERPASLRRAEGLMSSSALDLEPEIRDPTRMALLAEQ